MQILIVGGGGREHALAWKLAQSPRAKKIYCAPGNAGISRIAECINLKPSDLSGLANFAESQRIDLTVVGPEAPLAAGIVDRFEARGLPIFGPSTDPARIEGSKAFAKEIMVRYGIPTGAFRVAAGIDEAHEHVRDHFASELGQAGAVIKADGLAAGKGVIVVGTEEEAHAAVDQIMRDREFGSAGDTLLVEERLTGQEVSIMAFTDGEHLVAMPPSQDHKRALDGDQGPNTGGMGAYSPVPVAPPELVDQVVQQVLAPAVRAIRDLGIPYKGVLYAGMMLTPAGLRTLEFNCRFGDPETQVVLPLLETDLLDLLESAVSCCLDEATVRWSSQAAVNVVAASGGYPGAYQSGKPITGLDRAAQAPGSIVLHAGTRDEAGQVLTDGGRVLSVTALGRDFAEAQKRAYEAMGYISFEGMHVRSDIGARAVAAG